MRSKEELISLIAKVKNAYYNSGEDIMSDYEYDKLIDELRNNFGEYEAVGAPVLDGLKKISIEDKPMLSLDKVHSADEIIAFNSSYDMIASVKCDGLSTRLIYRDGKLVSANTRGNGFEGTDITEHIRHFLNVPMTVNKNGTYIIDGESIIYDADFAIVNKNGEFKNNRNTASGALSLLDMAEVGKRRLSFIAWDIIEGGNFKYYHENIQEAYGLGFTVVPYLVLDCSKIEKSEIDNINENILSTAEDKGIPCDGVVWRINDNAEGAKKGKTAHHFLNAVAWKPVDESAESVLIDIDYDVSRQGILTPVAVFEPVDLEGSEVSRASLHNISVMTDTLHGPGWKGQLVRIVKKNQIIPQIIEAEEDNNITKEYFERPNCPICGSKSVIKTSDAGIKILYCPNEQCPGKLAQQIEHFFGKTGLDAKGISRKTIEFLIDKGWVNSIFDMFTLDKYEKEWSQYVGWGVVSVSKALDSIAKSRETSLDKVLTAAGIPLIGTNASKYLAKQFKNYSQFMDFVLAEDTSFENFEGFGYEMDSALKYFDYSELNSIVKNYLNIKENIEEEVGELPFKGKIFVITGKLKMVKNRDTLIDIIEKNGGKVTGSVSKNTSILINNDTDSDSAKNKKAKELNIPIISEEELLNQCVIKE